MELTYEQLAMCPINTVDDISTSNLSVLVQLLMDHHNEHVILKNLLTVSKILLTVCDT